MPSASVSPSLGSVEIVAIGFALAVATAAALRLAHRRAAASPSSPVAEPPSSSSSSSGAPDRPLAAAAALPSAPSGGTGTGATAPEPRIPRAPTAGPIEALLAEDNDVNALVLTRHLEKLGCRVTRAATGADAVAAARKGSFEIVFMDWRMPEMDGLEAIRHIRRIERYATVPIVAVTANALPGDRETCLRAGADEYVTKPVDAATLRAALARFGLDAPATGSATASDRSRP